MKNITNTLFGASLLLAAVLGINSCRKPSVEGDFVRFSARTFSSPLTKTAYSGEVSGGKERINWVSGDQLTIACAQCGDPSVADYRVTGTITSDGAISEADALTPVSGNGLQWGTGAHTFYAVYPADVANVTKEGVASATIPASQGGTDTDESISAGVTTVSMTPDMSNAFMYASQTASPGENVELTFNPMFTAFQFTVGGDGTSGDVTLSQVELSSTSCALSGDFSLNIGSTTYSIRDAVTEGTNANNKIKYTFPPDTKINTNQKVCFTLFVQPRSNVTGNANHEGMAGVITDLTIRFTLDGGATRALKLKYADSSEHGGAFVDFPGGKKINITGLTLPTQLKSWSFTVFDVEDWDDDSPDILYGSPEVVEPGEGWIAETFAPDVNNLREVPVIFYVSPLGSFTVSSSGDKVRFSPGNLQYQASTGIWRFAAHQWDYVGDATYGNVYEGGSKCNNTSIGASYSGWIDLFGWGTSGHNFPAGTYGGCFQPWSTDQYSIAYGPTDGTSGLTGDYADGDWGFAAASTLGPGWRTLTNNEWTYLLDTRGGGGYPRYCKATVNGVSGLVIFPDDGYYYDFSVLIDIHDVNIPSAAFTSNTWDGDVWTMMESAGCVFLPAAGARSGTRVYVVGSQGYYWSSTPSGAQGAYHKFFLDESSVVGYGTSRDYGYSVRLVQDL